MTRWQKFERWIERHTGVIFGHYKVSDPDIAACWFTFHPGDHAKSWVPCLTVRSHGWYITSI